VNEILLALARHGLVKLIVGEHDTTIEYRQHSGITLRVGGETPIAALEALSAARWPETDPAIHSVPNDDRTVERIMVEGTTVGGDVWRANIDDAEAVRLLAGPLLAGLHRIAGQEEVPLETRRVVLSVCEWLARRLRDDDETDSA